MVQAEPVSEAYIAEPFPLVKHAIRAYMEDIEPNPAIEEPLSQPLPVAEPVIAPPEEPVITAVAATAVVATTVVGATVATPRQAVVSQ